VVFTEANNPVSESLVGKSAFLRRRHSADGVHRAAIVIEKVQLAILSRQGDDANRGPRISGISVVAVALEASGPQTPRFPVAKDVCAAQLGELFTA